MKQIWPNYSYSPATNVLTLTGLNIDRDQLLLVTAADRGRIMYNFADSSVTASAFTSGANTALTLVATTAGLTTTAALVIYYDDQTANNSVTISSLPAISGTVTVGNSVTISSLPENLYITIKDGINNYFQNEGPFQVSGNVGLMAGSEAIGSVSVSNISSLPDAGDNAVIRTFMFGYDYAGDVPVAIAANGTAISVAGSVTASISNSVVTFYPQQGTTVSNTNFTSTTASTTLVSAVAGREVLTVFNEGAGNLHISPGATCTTISYQVRLSAGDYWECPAGQTSLLHTAVFASAGTARVTQVS